MSDAPGLYSKEGLERTTEAHTQTIQWMTHFSEWSDRQALESFSYVYWTFITLCKNTGADDCSSSLS